MKHKVSSHCGIVVDKNGNIKHAWQWNSGGECPLEFELSDGDEFFNIAKDKHDIFCDKLHLCRVDKMSGHVLHSDTGNQICVAERCASKKQSPDDRG